VKIRVSFTFEVEPNEVGDGDLREVDIAKAYQDAMEDLLSQDEVIDGVMEEFELPTIECKEIEAKPERPLFKSTIVIWSDTDPYGSEISALARDAENGDSYCSRNHSELVRDPTSDPDWDGTDFFNGEDLLIPEADDKEEDDEDTAEDGSGAAGSGPESVRPQE
jgi:hypothetical protein